MPSLVSVQNYLQRHISPSPARRYLAYAYASFFVGLVVCLVLAPEALWVNHGLSYFGTQPETFWPFAAASVIGAFFIFRAAVALPHVRIWTVVRYILLFTAPLYAVVGLTPYTQSDAANGAHQAAGSALFVAQLLLAGWWAGVQDRSRQNAAWFAAIFASGWLAYFSWQDYLLISLEAQVLYQVFFGVVVWRMVGLFQGERGVDLPT